MGRPPAAPESALTLYAAVAAIALLLAVAPWIAGVYLIQADRADEIEAAFKTNANLALALEEHTVRTLRGIDQIVLLVKRRVEQPGPVASLGEIVSEGADPRFGHVVHNVGVIDAHGNLAWSSEPAGPLNFADRAHFRAHVERDTGELYIDAPIVGRITGKASIVMSRRISRPDGSFGGTAYASIDPEYFSRLYSQVDLGPRGLVTIFGSDGIVRARQSGSDPRVGQDIRDTALFRAAAAYRVGGLVSGEHEDGVVRLVSFRSVPGYPLVVAVGTAESDVLTHHVLRKRRYYSVAALANAFILVFAALTAWLIRRRQREAHERIRAERALRESEARQAAIVETAMDAIVTVDADRRIVVFNRAAERMFRLPAPEALGQSLDRFVATASGEGDRPCGGSLASRLLSEGEADAPRPFVGVRSDGTQFPIEASISRHDREGRSYCTIIVRDESERRSREEALRRFRAAINATADGVFLVDVARWRYLDCNDAFCRMLGYSREDVLALPPERVVDVSRDALESRYAAIVADRADGAPEDCLYRRSDGVQIPVEVLLRPLGSSSGSLIVGVARDIRARLRAERLIKLHSLQQGLIARLGQEALTTTDTAQLLARAAEVVGEGLVVDCMEVLQFAADGRALDRRAGFGWAPDCSSRGVAVVEPGTMARFVLDAGEPVRVPDLPRETRFAHPQWLVGHGIRSGVQIRIGGSEAPFGLLGAYRRTVREFSPDSVAFVQGVANILAAALERLRVEEKALRLAQFDTLTGLPNRGLMGDRLAQLLAQTPRHEHKVGVVVLDLDGLGLVNDSYGRAVGDALLVTAAQRLRACARAGDSLGSLGGDEFALLVPHLDSIDAASARAQELAAELSRPYEIDGRVIHLTASLGVAVFPDDGGDAEALLKSADIALYRAKEQGGDRIQFYTEALNVRAIHRRHLADELRGAIERDQLELHYQPQVSLDTGRIVGLEALIRWRHPERGLLPPVEFIAIAEEMGLIVPIGDWVLRRACRQAAEWNRSGRAPIYVSVNVSARQVQHGGFAASVRAALEASGLEPRALALELTESGIMEDIDTFVDAMSELRHHGVSIAIDDFGTGYSSLSYVKRLPVDIIKIDRSFIRDIVLDPDDAAIARAVIAMSHQLRIRVVAEGVETREQANFLRRNRCDMVQGYLFGAPAAAPEVSWLLDDAREEPLLRAPATSPRALLLVDDEENNLRALKRVFRAERYQIHTATCALEAFEILANTPIGVIVSDQRMPGMSGTEFLARVKAMYPETVRIVLSGYTDLAAVTSAINEGAIYKFLTKPWNDEALRADIREAFQLFDDRRLSA